MSIIVSEAMILRHMSFFSINSTRPSGSLVFGVFISMATSHALNQCPGVIEAVVGLRCQDQKQALCR